MHDDIPQNGAPMARIDGEKIRRLRESKGLTQLYVATAVGVTTDTISRWENRRYPSIKKDNALKLAEALEAPLSAILEESEPEEPAREPPPEIPRRQLFPKAGLMLLVLLLLVIAGVLGWWAYHPPPPLQVEAVRVLPPHVPPGQPFPVVIRIVAKGGGSSLIVKETIPAAAVPLSGLPAFTRLDREERVLRWIGSTTAEPKTFAYLVRTEPQARNGERLQFTGTVMLRQEGGSMVAVAGSQSLEVAPYHWADLNRDNRIDDEEILTVYDTFGSLEEMEYDRELIENIWAAAGYRWNETARKYEIIP